MTEASDNQKGPSQRGLLYIALFKLFKGVLLLIVGVGALRLLHKDVAEIAMHWIDILRVDPGSRFIHAVLSKMLVMDDRKLKEISAGTFFYAALLLTEGMGLWYRKHWAEYFTIVTTGVFIPLEIYELIERFTVVKVLVLGVNVAIVWYLVAKVMQNRRRTEAK